MVIAAAIPLYLPPECRFGCTWSTSDLPSVWHWLHPTGQASRTSTLGAHPSLWKDAYWLAALSMGFLAPVWWYRRRARKVGVETSTRPYAQVTLFVLVFPLLGVPVLTRLLFNALSWPLALPVLVVGVVGVVVATTPAKRRLRTVVAVLSLILFAHLAMIFAFGPLLVVAVGVLGLAWVERSAVCTTFAVLFAVWVVVVNAWSTWVYGSFLWPAALLDYGDLLSSSLILVLGGAAGLVARRVRDKVPA